MPSTQLQKIMSCLLKFIGFLLMTCLLKGFRFPFNFIMGTLMLVSAFLIFFLASSKVRFSKFKIILSELLIKLTFKFMLFLIFIVLFVEFSPK